MVHLNCNIFLIFENKNIIKKARDFPGGAVVKNPPANGRGHGFKPWSGKVPHAMEQLSPCATTTEPAL